MPSVTPAALRKQIAKGDLDPIYLIVGDDEVEMSRLSSAIAGLIEESLRAFNADRFYAGDKGVTPVAIVEAARMLPMLGERRTVTVMRAERLLKPKRRGKSAGAETQDPVDEVVEPPSDLDVLEAYLKNPVPQTTLVLVAADVDRTRRIYKALQKHATIVECWGLRGSRDAKPDLRAAVRTAEQLVREAVARAGQQIEPAAARLLATRAGTEIATLRGDVDRLLLYTAGQAKITAEDARQVVSAETAQDDWAVTNAIERHNAAEALRQLSLALEAGGVPYQILGQLGWFVRERMAATTPRKVPSAIESLFRTDLDLKSSAGDPQVLLERLVVELCRG